MHRSQRIGLYGLACGAVVSLTSGSAADVVRWNSGDGGNGHYYEAISVSTPISWTDANAAAIARGGHLATLTSADENEFVFDEVANDPLLWAVAGRAQGPWVGGVKVGSDWTWVTGEAWSFEAWEILEPTNLPGEEYLHYFGFSVPAPKWNDNYNDGNLAVGGVVGYVVEYVPAPSSMAAVIGYGLVGLRRRR